tara:strand:+ start:265 stop:1545 length:1281 start_codon:yes stop_codon:yes gene_type:complete
MKLINIILSSIGYVFIIFFKSIFSIVNIFFDFFSYIKFFIYKLKGNILKISAPNKHPLDETDKKLESHQLENGKFVSVSIIRKGKKDIGKEIKFTMSNEKSNCLKKIKNFYENSDLKKSKENYFALENVLKELDNEFKLDLYKSIIKNLHIPCFIKTNTFVWESILEDLWDWHPDEKALTIESPSGGSIRDVGFESIKSRTQRKIALDSDFSSSIKLRLLNEEHIFKHGYKDSSERFGDWVNVLDMQTNHFLSLATIMEKSIHEKNNNKEIEIHTRQVFYYLIMAADAELKTRFSEPLKEFIKFHTNEIPPTDDRMSEFSKFLLGTYPPTLAGVGRVLNIIRDEIGVQNSELSSLMIDFINKTDYLDQDRLFSGRFIDFLFRIGKLRGSIMHPSELNKNEMFEAIDFLTGFTELGGFYYHIGVEKV